MHGETHPLGAFSLCQRLGSRARTSSRLLPRSEETEAVEPWCRLVVLILILMVKRILVVNIVLIVFIKVIYIYYR